MTDPIKDKQAIEKEEGAKGETDQTMKQLIIDALGRIPKVRKAYKLPTGVHGTIDITDKTDRSNFSKLYTMSTKKTTGNGEVALFWLFNCQSVADVEALRKGNPKKCFVNQGGDNGADPDLRLGTKTFMEVKATGNTFDQPFSLGRFGRFSTFINLVGLLQGFEVAFGEQNLDRNVTTLKNVNYEGLADAADVFCEVRNVVKRHNLGKYKYFDNLKDKFDRFDAICDDHEILRKCKYGGNVQRFRPGGEEIAKRLLAFVAQRIISEKPGDGNWILQVPTKASESSNIKIHCYKPVLANLKLDSLTERSAFEIKNESIKINFKKVFG